MGALVHALSIVLSSFPPYFQKSPEYPIHLAEFFTYPETLDINVEVCNEVPKSSSTGYTCTLGKALHHMRDIPCPFACNELIVDRRTHSRDNDDALPS